MNTLYIAKASGEREAFNIDKFKRSLRRAGAPNDIIEQIIHEVMQLRPYNTQELHHYAFNRLRELNPPLAARYNIKQAIMDLGPAGFPFEKFVAEIFKKHGYTALTGQIVVGKCVDHEVDVVAQKDNELHMVECKFHNQAGLKSDVKIALYVKARFQDINESHAQQSSKRFAHAWLATNTQLTTQAIQYAQCAGLRILSWSFPKGNSLPELIDSLGLHPVTALTTINKSQKQNLIHSGLILCEQLLQSQNQHQLKLIGLKEFEINQLLQEAKGVCELHSK